MRTLLFMVLLVINREQPVTSDVLHTTAVRKNSSEENKWLIAERLKLWMKACKISCTPTRSIRICGKHFVKGNPANLDDTTSIDWVPTLFLHDGNEVCDKSDTPNSMVAVPDMVLDDHNIFAKSHHSNSDTIFESMVVVREEVVCSEGTIYSGSYPVTAAVHDNGVTDDFEAAYNTILESLLNGATANAGRGLEAELEQDFDNCGPLSPVHHEYDDWNDMLIVREEIVSSEKYVMQLSMNSVSESFDASNVGSSMLHLEPNTSVTIDGRLYPDLDVSDKVEYSDEIIAVKTSSPLNRDERNHQCMPTHEENAPDICPEGFGEPHEAEVGFLRLLDCWTDADKTIHNCESEVPEQEADISQNNMSCGYITTSLDTSFKEDVFVQTEERWMQEEEQHMKHRQKLMKENEKLKRLVEQLKVKLARAEESTRYTVTTLEHDNTKCNYITGISSGLVLRQLYEALHNYLPNFEKTYREKIFVMTFRKIRLNEPFYTLGLTYDMHHSAVADKFFQMIHCIYPFMAGLVKWPAREVLKAHMPASFRQKYGDRVTIILDCFEVPIESPRAEEMTTNANVFSFYKHHRTVKVLAGITAAGCYSFISEAFGGRVSDQLITRMSGILDFIEEGDFVMADRGFLVEDLLKQRKASLTIPAFKKAKQQLEPLDASDSKELSSLRIHVERLIGSLRQKMLILSNIIPITLLERWNGSTPVLDQILKISAAVVNLCPSMVPQ